MLQQPATNDFVRTAFQLFRYVRSFYGIGHRLTTTNYRAKVTMDVDRSLELPEDTSAAILTQGVLGDKLVALEPGGADEMIPDGGDIDLTQSAVVLERLIGRLVTSFGGGDGG